MKKQILILALGIFLISFASANSQNYYKLNLNYDQGQINISNLNIESAENTIENYFGFYIVEIRDYRNEVLNFSFFEVPNKIIWDGIDEETGEIDSGGEIELEEVEFEIFAPYYPNAKEIIIYDEELNELDSVDISMYSKDYRKDLLIDKEKIIIEETGETQEKEERIIPEEKVDYIDKALEYLWIFIVILVVLFLKLVWDLSSRHHGRTPKHFP